MAGATKLADTVYSTLGWCLTGHHEGLDIPGTCPGIVEHSNGQTSICNCRRDCHGTADLGREDV